MKNGDGNGVPSQNPFLSRPRDRKRRKLPKRLQTILLHSWGLKRFFCMALRMEQLSVMTQAISSNDRQDDSPLLLLTFSLRTYIEVFLRVIIF